ncbi:MAG: hypothetical protein HZB26_13760 [Candidatus Hydrogenedentes bacterium]|nr:hypothetical protein [Candidatus Hydrogenedentota bacterium]
MFWKIICEDAGTPVSNNAPADGRFVVHRHIDADGPHLDLRVEMDNCLMGWRVDGLTLEGGPWATEKRPHPLHWLEQPGDAIREESGVYTWEKREADEVVLVLRDPRGAKRVRLQREVGLPPSALRTIRAALSGANAAPADAARLIADGATARRRAIERFCGLGRELDGSAFDETLWRKTLAPLTLDEIHAQLRAYEVRFDKAHPPQPVSQPESLPAWERDSRTGAAMAILREGECPHSPPSTNNCNR